MSTSEIEMFLKVLGATGCFAGCIASFAIKVTWPKAGRFYRVGMVAATAAIFATSGFAFFG